MGNQNQTAVSSTDNAAKPRLLAVPEREQSRADAKLSPRRSDSLLRRSSNIRNSMRKQRPMGLHPRRNFLRRRKTRAPPRQPLTPDEKEFLAAAGRGDLETVQVLLRNGVGIETADANEMTALHHAAKHARDRVIKYLLDRGANVNASDLTGGFSPIHWVIINSCPQMTSKNHVEESIIALARGGCDLNSKDFNLATPLHIAAQKGHKSTIDTLVRLGANPLAVDVMGRSCLQLAKSNEIRDFIKSLHYKKESVVYHVLEVPPSASQPPSPPKAPLYHVLEVPSASRSPSPPTAPLYHVMEVPSASRSPSPPTAPLYHVLEVPSPSRSPSPPTIPAPAKKPCLRSIAHPRNSPTPPPSNDFLLLRNLPQFRHTDSPSYPAPPPPPRSRSSTPHLGSRASTPDYSVIDIPVPYRFRPLPVPPTQVPSPLYRYNITHSSSPIPPPPPRIVTRRKLSRKSSTSSSSRHQRRHQNH